MLLRLALAATLLAPSVAQPPLDGDTALGVILRSSLRATVPSPELVFRAHRSAQVQLEDEFTCTSLSGPACPSGVAASPSAWSRTRSQPSESPLPDFLLPPMSRDGVRAPQVFAFPGSAFAFAAQLAAAGDWLVLFYSADCLLCTLAADALRGAAPQLGRVRLLAVSCAAGSPTQSVCDAHAVTSLPEVRLFLGSPLLSVKMQAAPEERKKPAPVEDGYSTSTSSSSDEDDDEYDDSEYEDHEAQAAQLWTAEKVLAFVAASTTPQMRALLDAARAALSPFSAARLARAAAVRRVSAELEEGEEGELAGGTDSSRLAQTLSEMIGAQAVGGEGGEAALLAFRGRVERLLADSGDGATQAGEGDLARRSMASRARRHLLVINARPAAIEIWWLDFEGLARRFARVEPARSVKLATFAKHAWRVQEAASGRLISTVTVKEGEPEDVQRVVVT